MSVWKLCKDEMPKENSNVNRYMIAHEHDGELINAGVITSYYDGWNCSKSYFSDEIYKKAEIKDVVAWCEAPEIDVELEDKNENLV